MKNFKRIFTVLAAVFVLSLGLASCSNPANDTSPLSSFAGTIAITPNENVTVGTTLTAVYSRGTETGLSYQWEMDGGPIVGGANSETHTPAAAGSYTVTVSKDGYTSITSAAVTVTDAVSNDYVSVSYETLADDLAAITGDSAATPVTVKLAAMAISTAASAPAESTGWGEIYAVLAAAQKYVILDLSECSFTDNAVTGKNPPAGNDMNIIKDSEHIKGVIFPEGVTDIGSYAFRDCSGLTSITIPSGVKTIGPYAFSNCTNLTSINIPEGVASIGNNAFQSCYGLTDITIPESVTSIENTVFINCTGLTDISIPGSVASIGYGAFARCTGLASVTISSGVTSIGNNAFQNCTGLTDISIPASVTSIGNFAFHNTGLASIIISSGVTSIGDHAFYDCTGLTSVTFTKSDVEIWPSAFAYFASGKSSEALRSLYLYGTNGANGAGNLHADSGRGRLGKTAVNARVKPPAPTWLAMRAAFRRAAAILAHFVNKNG